MTLQKCSTSECKSFERKFLGKGKFEKIVRAILALKREEMKKNGGQVYQRRDGTEWIGTDGSTWVFEVTANAENQEISLWSPGARTEERGLENFL